MRRSQTAQRQGWIRRTVNPALDPYYVEEVALTREELLRSRRTDVVPAPA